MNNIFFTADSHFGHNNILKYSAKTRPFSNVDDMNEALIEAWNKTVKRGDTVYHLGDVFFKIDEADIVKIFNRLNGQKHLIYGNHDHSETRKLPWCSQAHAKLMQIGKRESAINLHLYHFPIVKGQWNRANHGTIHLFGHVHGEPMYDEPVRAIDVGVDSVGFAPISIEDVVNRVYGIPATKLHHNGERP